MRGSVYAETVPGLKGFQHTERSAKLRGPLIAIKLR